MMINNVSYSSSYMPQIQRTEQSLSSEQLTTLSDTLGKFDPDNLSEQDALSIVETLSEAGIQPGKAMEEAMAEAGFDAKSIGDLANVQGGGNPPPPPPQGQSSATSIEMSTMVEYLDSLLQGEDISSMSEEEKQSLYAQIADHFGLEEGESMISLKV